VIFLLLNLALWYSVQHENFQCVIQPGEKYQIGNKSYQVPNLPLVGKAYLLKDEYLQRQTNLLTTIARMMKENNIEYWISGGTLLGFTRHETFIPWDDDIDIHTHWDNRKLLYSDEFIDMVDRYNLEIIILFQSSMKSATKEGAAIRLREKNTTMPVCDVFFVKAMTDDTKEQSEIKYAKVDSWWNTDSVKFSTKEIWPYDYLFPTQLKVIDDIELRLPNKPVETLQCQYGPSALTKMYARSPWISHMYAYKVLSWVWHVKQKQSSKSNHDTMTSVTPS
jgi:phosphorylcholine metabolism protein LicD